MAACIAAPMSPLAAELDKVVSDSLESFPRPALQSDLRKDFIHNYVMAAARRDDSPPAASLLQDGEELAAASPSYVPLEQQSVYMAAAQKGLHDEQEKVRSPVTETHNEAGGGVHEEAIIGIQKLTEVVIELNNSSEASKAVHSERSNENCEKRLENKSNGIIPEGSTCTIVHTKVGASISGDAVEFIEFEGADENSTIPHLIGNEGGEAVGDSVSAHATPAESPYLSQRNSGANADEHREFGEVGKKAVFRVESTEILQESHTFDVNEVFAEHDSDQTYVSGKSSDKSESFGRNANGQTEFDGKSVGDDLAAANKVEGIQDVHDVVPASKVESKEKQASNTEAVGNCENATIISRSFSFSGLNHVAFCVESLERSLHFYCGLLGLNTNLDRPDLPYRGAWLFLGAEGIHLMEVPNPDPVNGRPTHGGWDRHACLNCKNVEGVRLALEKEGIEFQRSPVPSIFTRDPDGNGLEFIEVDP